MKSRKQAWSIALCLLAAMALAIGLRARSTTAQSSVQPAPQSKLQSRITGPLVAASLPATMVPTSVLFAEAAFGGQNSNDGVKQNPQLPPVEEFTLTPPNPDRKMYKTTLAVRFPELPAEGLASQIPMTLGDQHVVLQRSNDDSRIFSAAVDFDWKAFAREQQQRKDLANTGREIPVFQGRRFVRMDKIHFVDPVDIENAVQSHQPIQFGSPILLGTGSAIDLQTELMITDLSVVQDPGRTWDPCASNGQGGRGVGTKMGPWTFGGLMAAIANDDPATHHVADQMVEQWLELFEHVQTVNTFQVQPRSGMAGVISQWKSFAADGNNVDVSQAPFQLNAIVNRVDIGQGSATQHTTAGELRFIFGYAPCPASGEGQSQKFNVIVEYNVPLSNCSGAEAWAAAWKTLETAFEQNCNNHFPCPSLNDALLSNITSQVAAAPGASVNLNEIRTNEVFLQFPIWELRAFELTQHQPPLIQVPIFETPQGDPNGVDYNQSTCIQGSICRGLTTTNFINTTVIDFPGTYIVPLQFGPPTGQPFQGGSAFNAGLEFWNGSGTINSNVARSDFSANTCNGCHGREVETNFQQVFNRQAGSGSPSDLSAFLVGCSVKSPPLSSPCLPPGQGGTNTCNLQNAITGAACVNELVSDPVIPPQTNSFGDLSRRSIYLSNLLGGNCQSDQLLRSLVQQPVNFSH
jgi:hypothetical protein